MEKLFRKSQFTFDSPGNHSRSDVHFQKTCHQCPPGSKFRHGSHHCPQNSATRLALSLSQAPTPRGERGGARIACPVDEAAVEAEVPYPPLAWKTPTPPETAVAKLLAAATPPLDHGAVRGDLDRFQGIVACHSDLGRDIDARLALQGADVVAIDPRSRKSGAGLIRRADADGFRPGALGIFRRPDADERLALRLRHDLVEGQTSLTRNAERGADEQAPPCVTCPPRFHSIVTILPLALMRTVPS